MEQVSYALILCFWLLRMNTDPYTCRLICDKVQQFHSNFSASRFFFVLFCLFFFLFQWMWYYYMCMYCICVSVCCCLVCIWFWEEVCYSRSNHNAALFYVLLMYGASLQSLISRCRLNEHLSGTYYVHFLINLVAMYCTVVLLRDHEQTSHSVLKFVCDRGCCHQVGAEGFSCAIKLS